MEERQQELLRQINSIIHQSIFLQAMLTHGGILKQMCVERSCECVMVGTAGDSSFKEGLFLVSLSKDQKAKPTLDSRAPTRSRVRKSLKAQRGDKENLITNDSSLQFKQTNTCFSSDYFLEQPSTASHKPFLTSNPSQRSPLIALATYQSNCIVVPDVVAAQTLFEVKKFPTATNQAVFNKKPTNIRFFSNQLQKGEDFVCGSKLRENVKLDRAQSSDNLTVPKLMLPNSKEKGEWRSQFVNIGEERSNSKRTHRLTDLQVKCTESIHDSESLEISQVVSLSESETSRSQSNRTQTVPRRMRDLLHMKYSKVQGRKH